jgi:YebC/PmpR family DNA-binding regulatory protein
MAGHSHSHNIAVRKGKQDKKRAIEFSKASKEIIIAARLGADPSSNFQLRHAIQKARAISLPKEKIEHAIKKGAGTLEGQGQLHSITYEGYAPGGTALLVECLTDNLNRTAPIMRSLFDKAGGSIGSPGSVSYQFKRKGLFVFEGLGKNKEELEELLILNKEFDVSIEELAPGKYEVLCSLEEFQAVMEFLSASFELEVSELALIPDNPLPLSKELAERVARLIEQIEENEDCTHVYTNADLSALEE